METNWDGLNAVAIARTVQWLRPTAEQEACREHLAACVAEWEAAKLRKELAALLQAADAAVVGNEPAPQRARRPMCLRVRCAKTHPKCRFDHFGTGAVFDAGAADRA